jgi:DnaJ domain
MLLLKNQLNFHLALAKLPALHLYGATPPQVLDLIKSILEEFYTDGIDQVLSAKLDSGGNIVGEFSDRVGARQLKRYQYQITDSEVTYKLLNPSEVSSFSIESFNPLFGVGARAGKKKNCAKSTPCGDSCIAAGKVCRKKPGSAVKAKIEEVRVALGEHVGKESKGDIVPIPQKKQKQVFQKTYGVDPIDAKYASSNPTDTDVENWYQEKIKEKPTPESIEAAAIKETSKSIQEYDLRKKVTDRETYARTAYADEQLSDKYLKKYNIGDPTTQAYWLKSLTAKFGDTDEVLEKKIKNAKTEKLKQKYQKQLEENKHWDEVEAPARAAEYAAKHKARKSMTRKERISQLKAEYDSVYARKKLDQESLHEQVLAGNKTAIKKRREQVYKTIPAAQRVEALEGSSKAKIYEKNAARLHLIAVSSNALVPEFNLPKKYSQIDVKKAYKKLAGKYHPDVGGTNEQFNRLTAVYEDLLGKAVK